MRSLPTIILLLLAAVTVTAEGSVIADSDGRATVEPVATIEAEALDESSGLQFWEGAWWSHNDSGGSAELFRSTDLSFKEAMRVKVPGAVNVDWEELAILDGDLIVCDIGDNMRKREDLKLYRLQWDGDTGELTTVATYDVSYSDGKHDAEAAFGIDGSLYIVSKHRGEGFTGVYRFDELSDDGDNVGEKVATLDLHERVMITAGDVSDDKVVLLSYTHAFTYPADKLEGEPEWTVRLYAAQCEAACLHEGALVYGNEQRDIYRVPAFLKRSYVSLLPAPAHVELPFREQTFEPDASGRAWQDVGRDVPLKNLGEDESLRWVIGGGYLMLAGKFKYDSFQASSGRGDRIGSGLLVMFSRDDKDFIEEDDALIWLGDDGATGLDAWNVDPDKFSLDKLDGSKVRGKVHDGVWYFEYALPLTSVFGEGELPEDFRANVWALNLHGEDEPHLAGRTIQCFRNPYVWAQGTVLHDEN